MPLRHFVVGALMALLLTGCARHRRVLFLAH